MYTPESKNGRILPYGKQLSTGASTAIYKVMLTKAGRRRLLRRGVEWGVRLGEGALNLAHFVGVVLATCTAAKVGTRATAGRGRARTCSAREYRRCRGVRENSGAGVRAVHSRTVAVNRARKVGSQKSRVNCIHCHWQPNRYMFFTRAVGLGVRLVCVSHCT